MEFADIYVQLFPGHEHMRISFYASRLISPKSPLLLHPDALKRLVVAIIDELRLAVTAAFDIDSSAVEVRRDPNWAKFVNALRLDLA